MHAIDAAVFKTQTVKDKVGILQVLENLENVDFVLFLGYITTWLLILDCIDLPNKYLNVHYKQGWMMI